MCLDTFFRYYGNFVDMMRRARAPNKPRKSILNRDTRLNGCLLDLAGWITRYKHLYLCAYKYHPEERLVRMHPGKALVAGAMVGSGLWLFGTPALSALGISVGTFLLSGGWKFMKLLFQTFPRDVRYRLTYSVIVTLMLSRDPPLSVFVTRIAGILAWFLHSI